jgi:hypothetical protein
LTTLTIETTMEQQKFVPPRDDGRLTADIVESKASGWIVIK